MAKLSSHKSFNLSLDNYAVASHQQQRQMSKILSGKENSNPKPKQALEENLQNKFNGSTVQESFLNRWHIFRSKHWCRKHSESCPSQNLCLKTSFANSSSEDTSPSCYRIFRRGGLAIFFSNRCSRLLLRYPFLCSSQIWITSFKFSELRTFGRIFSC